MKTKLLYIVFCLVGLYLNAQQEFHVFPKNHSKTPGTEVGNGSLTSPWDLQTALSQKTEIVNSGDAIWLHEGIYNGRFVSTIESLEPNRYITVSAFENEIVILNGNVESTKQSVLDVQGKQVIYKNFDITFLGDFSRDENDTDFEVSCGLRHLSGVNCRFYNLRIYNIPGLGMGSWKNGGGTTIQDCMIYNNGYISKDGKGRGEGIYVQNRSDEERLIKNNIIFNNYYKGIEVWSAGKRANYQYVKNITLDHNIIFNSGSPSGMSKDNVIVASADRNGINIAQNIKVLNNILYHNTDVKNAQVNGDAASLTLGFYKKAPVEDVIVDNNIVIGRNNALRLLYAKSLIFTNNTVYSGYVSVAQSIDDNIYPSEWVFNSNSIFTKNGTPFVMDMNKKYTLTKWETRYGNKYNSVFKNIREFDLKPILTISKNEYKNDSYTAVLYDKDNQDITVDFSEYKIKTNTNYTIYDAENPNIVLKSGTLTNGFKITFPMQLTDFEQPLHNTKAEKTESNFGVFIIEFDDKNVKVISDGKKDNALQRFFKWLGF